MQDRNHHWETQYIHTPTYKTVLEPIAGWEHSYSTQTTHTSQLQDCLEANRHWETHPNLQDHDHQLGTVTQTTHTSQLQDRLGANRHWETHPNLQDHIRADCQLGIQFHKPHAHPNYKTV